MIAPSDMVIHVPYNQGVKVYEFKEGQQYPTRLTVEGRWDIEYDLDTGRPVTIVRDGVELDAREHANPDFHARSFEELQDCM